MGRAAPFVVAQSVTAFLFPVVDETGEERRMDQVMAELTLAFARDIEMAGTEPVGEKWPMAWSLAFVVVSSVALWVLVAVLIAAAL